MVEITVNNKENVQVENEIAKKLATLNDVEEKILNTALKYFETQGYYQTNVEDVAKEIGIGKGTIYRHFGDKFHLLCYTLAFAVNNQYEELKQTLEIEDSYAALNTYITETLRISKSFVNVRKTSTMEIAHIYMKKLSINNNFIMDIISINRLCSIKILDPIIRKCAAKNNIELDDLFISRCITMFLDTFSSNITISEFFESNCDPELVIANSSKFLKDRMIKEVEMKRFIFRAVGTSEDLIEKYATISNI